MSGEYDRSGIPDLSEIGGQWDPRQPAYHGADHGYIAPGRLVARIPGRSWPNTPEECTAVQSPGEWICEGRVMVCSGCGVDST